MEEINLKNIETNYSKLSVFLVIFIQIGCIIYLLFLAKLGFFSKEYLGEGAFGIGMIINLLIIILIIFDMWGKYYSNKKIKECKVNNKIIPKSIKILKITSSLKIILLYFIILLIIKIFFVS